MLCPHNSLLKTTNSDIEYSRSNITVIALKINDGDTTALLFRQLNRYADYVK